LHESGGRYEIVSSVRPAPLPQGLLEFIEAKAAKAMGEAPKPSGSALAGEPASRDDHGLGQKANRLEPVPVNPVNVAIIASMLDALPDSYASEYNDWLHVGFALRSFDDGEVGLALWKKFSERCPSKASETDFKAHWSSFDQEYTGRKITIGTLWRAATAHGWRMPRHWDRHTKIKD
jgi:hypothetical protein